MIITTKTRTEFLGIELRYNLTVKLMEQMISGINKKFVAPITTEIGKPQYKSQLMDQLKATNPVMATEVANSVEQLVSSTLQNALLLVPVMFYNMSLIYRCALFDAFVTDLIQLILLEFPIMLKSKKNLSYEEIIDGVLAGTILETIAQTAMIELGRLSFLLHRSFNERHA